METRLKPRLARNAMVPGGALRGSISIEYSAFAARAKCDPMAFINALISPRARKVGVPPPQCSSQMPRSAPDAAATSASSLSKYSIYLADLP
jgi:hypothetical protein